MNFADRPNRFDMPGYCIVLAGRTYDENGGLLLDQVYDGAQGDMRLWISYAGLQSIVQKFGDRLNLATAEDLQAAYTEAASLEAELDQTKAALAEAEAKLERISGLQKDGFKVARVQGRPKTKATP
jgi:hypothetical protein